MKIKTLKSKDSVYEIAYKTMLISELSKEKILNGINKLKEEYNQLSYKSKNNFIKPEEAENLKIRMEEIRFQYSISEAVYNNK